MSGTVAKAVQKSPGSRQVRPAVRVEHTLSEEQARRLGELIGEHVAAQIAESWKGAGHPEDVRILELEAELA